ncbi:hypothetical protein [Patiriisocius marinistellae]|uniref:hypothetical protein n=1 Tax=Patiriisocius marinistellae TaxID=2494560 RepID=UPI00125E93E5|nr:hypothetical protein [Patiriisocius marinistellae]
MNATIILKSDIDSSTILAYDTTNLQGYYEIIIPNKLSSFIIEITSLGFKSAILTFNDFDFKRLYVNDVSLDASETKLEEIFIKAEKAAVLVKNDTTVYNPEKFKDGSERTVEDLIGKLPGLAVKENGKITFKGKEVESVLLDGDNLFDSNYTIGTKNIDVDMVDTLEAIENYIENPLLHGIATTDAIAINLVLRKGKTDFSSTSNVGLGIENRADLNSNILGISKRLKSFATFSFNNIGVENSPYNYFSSNNFSLEDSNETDFKMDRLIDTGSLNPDLEDERTRINNNAFASLNSIFNISDRIGTKVNFDYKNDILSRNILNETNFESTENSSGFIENQSFEKKPELYNVKVGITYKLSDTELLEVDTKFKNEDIDSDIDFFINDVKQNSEVRTRFQQFKTASKYTKKVSRSSAVTSSFKYNNASLNESLFLSPDFRFDNNISSNQLVNSTIDHFKFDTNYLKSNDSYNFKLGVGYDSRKSDFESLLTEGSGVNISNNDFVFRIQNPWVEGNMNFKWYKFNFNSTLRVGYLSQFLETRAISNEKIKKNKFQFFPRFKIGYNINKKSSIDFNANYIEKSTNELYLFENPIFTSNRFAIKNKPSLENIKSLTTDIMFHYNNFVDLFQFNLGASYVTNYNNFFSLIDIDNQFIVNTREVRGISFDTFLIVTGLDKYASFMKSNVRLNVSYGINFFENIVDNSDIRENESYIGRADLNIKTGFLGIINFQNNVKYSNVLFFLNNNDRFEFSSFQNKTSFFLRPYKRLFFETSVNYFKPDIDRKEDFVFIDSELRLTTKSGDVDYSLISKNITPNKSIFSRTSVTDFSTTFYSYEIQEPYILFSVRFKI